MNVGDPVLYHPGNGGPTTFGIVVRVAAHDGDCDIDYLGRPDLLALDVKMGQGRHTFEPLDFTPDWTIEHCWSCGSRNPSFATECYGCHATLHFGGSDV